MVYSMSIHCPKIAYQTVSAQEMFFYSRRILANILKYMSTHFDGIPFHSRVKVHFIALFLEYIFLVGSCQSTCTWYANSSAPESDIWGSTNMWRHRILNPGNVSMDHVSWIAILLYQRTVQIFLRESNEMFLLGYIIFTSWKLKIGRGRGMVAKERHGVCERC